MGGDKPPRHVAVALVFDRKTHMLLMVSSRAYPGMWILPKGGIEDGETSGQAAVRESYEEAGTPGNIQTPSEEDRLMMLSLEAGAGQKRAAVWHIHIIETSEEAVSAQTEWPERHERIREWVTPRECLSRIQAWSSNPATSDDITAQGGMIVDSKKAKKESSQAKREKKSGAMEMALRQFVEVKGWEPHSAGNEG